MHSFLTLTLWLGCASNDSEFSTTQPSTKETVTTELPNYSAPPKRPVQPVFENKGNLDKGQKHPPLPADNPAWDWDAQGFVPDFGWYGEHNWSDVRMRVVGHLAMGFRDLARFHLLKGNWTQAINTHERCIDTLTNINTEPSKFAEEIRNILISSFQRDLQILQALQGSKPFPKTTPDALIHWRIETWKRQLNHPEAKSIVEIQRELTTRFSEPTVSKIDDFDNFVDRHKLRTELFQAYVDSLDPLLPSDLRWGYWRPTEMQRQAGALWLTLESMNSSDASFDPSNGFTPESWWMGQDTDHLEHPFTHTLSDLTIEHIYFASSYYAWLIHDQRPDFGPAQFGRLPTGDSIIDVGGQPGPMGIGTLMKLDLSDDAHNQWLTTYGTQIQNATPSKMVSLCNQAIDELNSYTHGSRFYNVKQFRNACTRQLARMGHYQEAKSIFEGSFPLHHQDWACPNREGLLLVILARLTALSESTDAGIQTLEKSIQSGLEFLEHVDAAEQGTITEPKPPMMKMQGPPPNNIQGNPPHPNHPQPQRSPSKP